jgi:hypothetical protein
MKRSLTRVAVVASSAAVLLGAAAGTAVADDGESVRITGAGSDSVRITGADPGSVRITED